MVRAPFKCIGITFMYIASGAFAGPARADLQGERAELRKGEAHLQEALTGWRNASLRLRQMADCEYNDNRVRDLAEMAERNDAVKEANAKLTASLRKIESEGVDLFGGPIAADACHKGPEQLRSRLQAYGTMVAKEQEANFPPRGQAPIEVVMEKSIRSLRSKLKDYTKWNCNQPKGVFDLIGKEACRRYRACSRGADPSSLYESVLSHLEQTRAAWVGPVAKGGSTPLKIGLRNVATASVKQASELGMLADRCGSAGPKVAEKGPAPSVGSAPGQPKAEVRKGDALRADSRSPSSLSPSREPVRKESGLGIVAGAVLRESEAGARVTGAEPQHHPDAPVAWEKPDWAAYDRYKESIGAPNIARGVDASSQYAGFLAANQVRLNSLEDALRLQRAINSTSIEVNGPESIGPSVYQDGIIGSRTKSAVYFLSSDNSYREVFLRELRQEGLI